MTASPRDCCTLEVAGRWGTIAACTDVRKACGMPDSGRAQSCSTWRGDSPECWRTHNSSACQISRVASAAEWRGAGVLRHNEIAEGEACQQQVLFGSPEIVKQCTRLMSMPSVHFSSNLRPSHALRMPSFDVHVYMQQELLPAMCWCSPGQARITCHHLKDDVNKMYTTTMTITTGTALTAYSVP